MGFNQHSWNNPINLNASELNRIEKGLKDSHDNLDILNESVANLQHKQLEDHNNILTLLNDSPNILNTINEIQTALNNNSNILNVLQDTTNLVTKEHLATVTKDFLKLKDIKQNGTSIIKDGVATIVTPTVDKFLNPASDNALSNKAIATELNSIKALINSLPTSGSQASNYLKDLIDDSEHRLVTDEEKELINSIKNLDIHIDIPEWAQQETKPAYSYAEIFDTPTIPTKVTDLSDADNYALANHTHNYSSIYASITHSHNEYALTSHTHTEYAAIVHTHNEFSHYLDTEATQSLIDTSINSLKDGVSTSYDTLKKLATAISNHNHDTLYASISHTHNNYALSNHNHDTEYASINSIPTVNDAALIVQLNGSQVDTFTANASSNKTMNIKALPNYSIDIGLTGEGNPRQVKFLSVNYTNYDSNNACFIKLGAMCSHGNGTAYIFMDDIFIGVTATGIVTCNVYKYFQSSPGSSGVLDNKQRYYGDVFWVIDTTNKIVDFYILCGQYSMMNFTPYTKIGLTTSNGITQSSGTVVLYSNGNRNWANGNGEVITTSGHNHNITDILNSAGNTITSTKVLSTKSHSNWTNNSTDDRIIPTMSFIAYWNGAYNSSNNSNLTYCIKGAFGDMATKNSADYSLSTHTHSYSAVYTGTSSTKESNTTLSTLRIGYTSGNLYIWNS